jgi:hypothetical protein
MAYFQTQTPNLGKFWRVLQYIEVVGIFNGHFWYIYGHLVYLRPFGIFTAIWYVLGPFGIFCGHLVYFMVIRNIVSRFGMLYQRKIWQP